MNQTANPLSKLFRQPQIYIKLPSQGKWWKPGSIEIPPTGELAVYSMTARDELMLKTPDALMNGSSTVEVIQSCIPSIKNAWDMPSVDLDAVLIAIRQASYGNNMDFNPVCPKCKETVEYSIDLSILSAKIKCPNYDETIKLEELEIFVKPHTYHDFNQASIESFEQQRVIAVANDNTLTDEEKINKFNEIFQKMLTLTVAQVARSVAAIKLVDGTLVENPAFISEFFANCDKVIWNTVKDHIQNLNNSNQFKNIDVECGSCKNQFTSPLAFETSNFFG